MTAETPTPARRARVLRPGAALVAAAVVAAASLGVVLFSLGWVLAALLTVLAVAVVLVATASAMRRGSRVLAPLAVALVAVLNPVVLQGLADHTRDSIGVVTYEPGQGLVLWGGYPGIAGWDAPETPEQIDVRSLVLDVQDSVRAIVDDTGDAVGWTWSVGDTAGGATTLQNGFGGPSMFVRVDSPTWATTDFDGSAPQRDILLAAVRATADELSLSTVTDAEGDVGTGDGVREYTDADGGSLTLTVAGGDVTVVYAGGPYLSGSAEEYQARMSEFAGLDLPDPLFTPALP